MTKLYKVDSEGKMRTWEITNDVDELFIESGLEFGEKVPIIVDIVVNSSGRTQEQQAQLEFNSRVAKQLRLGYHETREGAIKSPKFRAMKGKTYQTHGHTIDWLHCYLEPKLDGFRITSHKFNGIVQLFTYGNKDLTKALPHIVKALQVYQPNNCIADGELYKHGVPLQTIRSQATNPRLDGTHLEYHIFDMADTDLTYAARLAWRYSWIPLAHTILKSVPSVRVSTEKQAKGLLDFYTSTGYEGVVLKQGEMVYEHKKGVAMLKWKIPITKEFTILGFTAPTKGTDKGCVQYVLDNGFGVEFKVSHRGTSKAERRRLYRRYLKDFSDIIGNTMTVEYYGLSNDNMPVPNPVGIQINRESIGDL